jgi:hypothetical protein
MKPIIVHDPGHWLRVFNLSAHAQIFVNQKDALRVPGYHIAINDFISPYDMDADQFDLVFWTGLENVNLFKKNLTDTDKDRVISPTAWSRGICNPSSCYSLAEMCYDKYHKPNYNAEYIADLLVGRAVDFHHRNRAWAVHEVLKRNWQDRIIVTAREIDLARSYPELIASPAWDNGMPNYDQFENVHFISSFSGSLKKTFGDLFSKSAELHMPWGIYGHSKYSVVVQDHVGIYIDEKIARPMLATRPFIIIGPQYYLQNLQSLGFQTFDPVIDESYDLEPNDEVRWGLALDALEKLASQNTQSVHDKLKKRLQHNRKLVYNSEYWIGRLKKWLNEEIFNTTGQSCVIY